MELIYFSKYVQVSTYIEYASNECYVEINVIFEETRYFITLTLIMQDCLNWFWVYSFQKFNKINAHVITNTYIYKYFPRKTCAAFSA